MRSLTRNPRSVLGAVAVLLLTATPVLAQTASQYFPITPCRTFASFDAPGTPLTGGSLPGRQITVKGTCGIPSDATAISYNVTIAGPTASGFITLYPSDQSLPVVSSLNFNAGDVRGNGGVVPVAAAASDDLNIYLATDPAGNTGHVVLDVTGYFKEPTPAP